MSKKAHTHTHTHTSQNPPKQFISDVCLQKTDHIGCVLKSVHLNMFVRKQILHQITVRPLHTGVVNGKSIR